VDRYPHALIGLEDLTHIRERRPRLRRRRGKPGMPSQPLTTQQRRTNRHASQWAFAKLHRYLAYKAVLSGSYAIKVDAAYSSQQCPQCGYTAPGNRPDKGLLFVCEVCHHTLHADLIGARNVALRTREAWHDWVATGVLSERPDVSDDEAKAARRRRYAELRWSPDASSHAFAGSI
jgi:IS605 OrfB family transposase